MPYNPLLPPANSIQCFRDVDNTDNLVQCQRSRVYCGYGSNTNQTTQVVNVWERFPYPSTGYVTFRNKDFTIDGAMSRFTYNGSTPKWFDITATCNVVKGTGGSVTRTIEFVWYKNGVESGVVRQFQMNNESNIITGNGELYLESGDYIEPFIRNVENDDKALLTNCSFNIREDYDYVFRIV